MAIINHPGSTVVLKFLFSHPDITAILGNTDFTDAPVFPIGEQPESDAPYILYNYRTRTRAQQWWMSNDDLTMGIFDTDLANLIKLERTMVDILRRYELSAKEVNDWAQDNALGETRIKYIRHTATMNFDPQSQEGGVFGRTLMFDIHYTQTTGTDIDN